MKIWSKFININDYTVDFFANSEYIHRTFTFAQSHTLAWLLKPTRVNLEASSVLIFENLISNF